MQLERQLKETNRQRRQYVDQRDSISVQQKQTVIDDDQIESVRLERQMRSLRQFLQESREEISRLEIELTRKDRIIADLRDELNGRAESVAAENGSSIDRMARTTSSGSLRRPSVSYLNRNKASNEMYVKKGEKFRKVPDSQRPWVS